jgi:hypothetical protein
MHRHLSISSLFLFLSLLATQAVALPAPMSDAELREKSTLVALVRVLSVTCTGVAKDEMTGESLPSYSAKLKLLEVKKGSAKKGDVVTVTFHAIPKGILGPWAVFYYPGEEVWTHLSGSGGNYDTTWWNARGKTLHEAVITKLPTKPGETVAIPDAGQ